jgi:hypothetical protein
MDDRKKIATDTEGIADIDRVSTCIFRLAEAGFQKRLRPWAHNLQLSPQRPEVTHVDQEA